MRIKKIVVSSLLVCVSVIGCAQDIHFSQFDKAPLSLNPALTGAFNADHRIIANYKSQWRSVSKTYMTYGLSYDMGILKDRLNGGILGIGVQLYNDQAGINKMGLTQANISVAYHLPLNRKNFLTAGIQGGFAQRRITGGSMQWDNQYDPTSADGYNSGLPSGESSTFSNKIYGDISAGVMWSYNLQQTTITSNNNKKVTVGVSLFHINRPKQTFFDVVDKKMYMKLAVHVSSYIGFNNSNFSILPSGVWFNQGPANDIIIGSMFRYRLKESSRYTNFETETALSIGCHYRVGDAVILLAQLDWKNFMVGVSYDVNISQLASSSKGAGGLEVSVRYITPLFSNKQRMY
ncbi:MAG: PorP/SprF family type IX secretion system membrane protein [Bacteroidota bacterium]